MKTFLFILTMLTMMSFQMSKPSAKISTPSNQTLVAGLCDYITEGTIQKTVLQQCKGLCTYDGTTHKKTKREVISYEVVFIPMAGDVGIRKNSGAEFNEEVTQFIAQSNAGDQIIFRSIRAKAKGDCTQSLNSIPLTIE